MFVELSPCVDCARAIIQAGVVRVVINQRRHTEYEGPRYAAEHAVASAMLSEAGVAVRFAWLEGVNDPNNKPCS